MKQFQELSIIKFATMCNFIFGLAGIILSLFAKSNSVLFDALYSFTASFFTMISAKVVKLVVSGENRDYQFGYGSFEPFFILIRTMFILIMNTLLMSNALHSIFSGGTHVNLSLVLIYTAISIFICIVITVFLKQISRRHNSPVLIAEAHSWLNDTLLSIAVLIAFLLTFILEKTPAAFFIPYIDPGITLLLILFLIPGLIRQFFSNLRELLVAAPSIEVQEELERVISPYIEKHGFLDFQTYSTKRGRNLYIIVHIYMKKDSTVRRLDKIRKEMIRDIRKFWNHSDTDIIFTIDLSWIPLSVPQPISDKAPSKAVKNSERLFPPPEQR